jgi:hypothetical protein
MIWIGLGAWLAFVAFILALMTTAARSDARAANLFDALKRKDRNP